MPDTFITDPGAGGLTFASRDVAGVHHPQTKIEFGAGATATEVADADGTRLPVKTAMAASAARTIVADSAVAVSLLASNANRKCAYIRNTSSALLYVGLGTVDPTVSDYTEVLTQGQSYPVPACYTGQIKGIWASDPGDGGALVTELT